MRVLELPMNPGDLLWTVRVDHTDQAVSATTWRCPSQQPSSLWVQEEREQGLEVSILGLKLVLTLLLSASPGNPSVVES